MVFARKMSAFEPSIFVRLELARAKAREKGLDVIDLSVGTPDFPPQPHIMQALRDFSDDPSMYQYAIRDYDELLDAGIEWYRRRYGVALSRENACGLVGSQDGLSHLPLAILNPGDLALLPNPGYPMFHTGVELACAKTVDTPLLESGGFLPDLDAIDEETARLAKLLVISYPSNPIGRLAPTGFFEKVVAFAKKYDILVLHDNAYSELTFDGALGSSFLSAPGALDVGVEFNSLSKSYNLTGARISFAFGRPDAISALSRMKSCIDYGIFRLVQRMAIAALNGSQDHLNEQRAAYQRRRDALCGSLAAVGWRVDPPEGTMFCWARLPVGAKNSEAFAMDLLEETGVTVVPGIAFGSLGDRYVRFGLTQPPERIEEAAERIGAFLRQ